MYVFVLRFHMIIISLAAVSACTIASVALVQSWVQFWTILYILLFLYISCEIERVFRISYLQHIKFTKVLATKREMVQRETSLMTQLTKSQRELKIVMGQAEKDKREMEEERVRFRGMLGNVAHELKVTPRLLNVIPPPPPPVIEVATDIPSQ